jgi:hypothetical protein
VCLWEKGTWGDLGWLNRLACVTEHRGFHLFFVAGGWCFRPSPETPGPGPAVAQGGWFAPLPGRQAISRRLERPSLGWVVGPPPGRHQALGRLSPRGWCRPPPPQDQKSGPGRKIRVRAGRKSSPWPENQAPGRPSPREGVGPPPKTKNQAHGRKIRPWAGRKSGPGPDVNQVSLEAS